VLHRASLRDVIYYASPLRGDRRALGRDRRSARNRSMQRGSGGGAPGFSPASLSPSWWLDDRGQTTVAGPKISAWDDQSTGGLNDVSNATDAIRPLVGTLNSLQCPDFNGSSFLLGTTRNITQVLSAAAWTVYVVVNADTITAANTTDGVTGKAIFGQDASGYLGLALQIDGAGTGYRAVHTVFDTGNRHARSLDGSVLLATNTLIVARLTTTVQIRVGAADNVVGDACSGVPVGGRTQGIRVGSAYTGLTGLDGRLGTVLGFDTLIADGSANDLLIRAYLAAKYGCAA
jgi:hypothetical protein